jgi:hypothetical protein
MYVLAYTSTQASTIIMGVTAKTRKDGMAMVRINIGFTRWRPRHRTAVW